MRQLVIRAAALCALLATVSAGALAQTSPSGQRADGASAQEETPEKATSGAMSGGLYALEEVRRQLRDQREQIEQLRAALGEQTRLINELRARVEQAERRQDAPRQSVTPVVTEAAYTNGPKESGGLPALAPAISDGSAGQDSALEGRVARVEEKARKTSEAVARQLGSLTFSGDLRLRYESFYGQQNALPTVGSPDALGNPLSPRQRLRLRARLGVRGQIGPRFEWGLRLTTGSFPEITSTNQTLTDFFSHKNFSLDQAFITYKPSAKFQVQAGKFDASWARTEMTWDNDVSPEGLMETYTHRFKDSAVKEVAFQAWQLPVLERNSAFVLDAAGRVDFEKSRREGRDLALFGAQLRTMLQPSKNLTLRLSATDLYFSGTQFITPAQFFGPSVQFPVTVVIPAADGAPAHTVTTQVSIPRDLLVSGNANLGFSAATTNALNRDGRLASGYNLVDLIGRLDVAHESWPVMTQLNVVVNTQTRDVVSAGAGGVSLVQRNDERSGYWAEFQVGKDVLRLSPREIKRGDAVFNYTFIRIEKDAVLTPFNYSDLLQPSDVRAHRFILAYAVDPRVSLSLTGIFSRRANGLLGAFGQTPPGSLDRTLRRFQFDTSFRF